MCLPDTNITLKYLTRDNDAKAEGLSQRMEP